ncbi:MAG: DNRLRE domain-containing protein [Bacteroidota bacterium]
MKTIHLNILILLLSNLSYSQQTVTITTGSKWTDVLVFNSTKPGHEHVPNTNYSTYPRLMASAWTQSGSPDYRRTLLKFDLSEIPANATIQSATLYFYSDPNVTASNAWNGNSQLSGSNAVYLEKITQNWNSSTVTWNNQPPSTTSDRVWVGPSTSTTENLTIDIQGLVQDWVANPASNYGVKMRLETEVRYRARNYIGTDHTNTGLHPKLVISYTTDGMEVSDNFSTEINRVFQHVDRAASTTRLLLDYGLRFINIEAYNGVPSDSNFIDYDHWENLYTTLYSMQFRAPASMTAPKTLIEDIRSTAIGNTNSVPLISLHYKYEKYRADAMSQNLVYIANDQIYDVAGRTQSPFEIKETFAVTPKRDVLEGADHAFRFYAGHFYTNTGKTISQIQADFGDGQGYRNVLMDQDNYVTYNANGIKTLHFRVSYTDGTSYESRSQVEVRGVARACPSCRFTGNNAVELSFTATRPFAGEAASATVTIETADVGNVLDKPLIVVEGFDAWRIISPDNPDNNFDYDDLINDPDDIGSFLIDVDIDFNGETLSDALETAGYDLVFVDFDDGTTYIERNSYLLQTIIDWVNDNKVGTTPNVVLGMSMGGLVARYALRDMELNGQNHDTRLYVSHDSPHQGANVPVGVQAMVRHLSVQGLSVGLLSLIQVQVLSVADIVPELGSAIELQQSPAARQMLSYQVSGLGSTLGYDNSEHVNFMNELQAMGYPQQTRNVAIANGSECGADQGYSAGATIASANATIDVPYWVNLLMPLAIFTNYPQAGFLSGIFTTDTDIRFVMDVRALPDQSSQRVYYSRLYTKKKILFAITVRTTLFEKEFNSNSSMLPLDNGSGGVYDIEELGVNIATLPPEVQLNEPRFGFVPTYSALDMGEGDATIQTGDLFRVISPSVPPTAPKDIPFDNFFSNPITNELHTQFTLQNGRWLMDELENGGGFYSCASSCDFSPNVNISGPSTVCTAGTFSVTGLPADVGYIWSRSSNLNQVSGQGTSAYRVSKNGNGNAWVEVRFIDDCGTTNAKRRNIWLGDPEIGALNPSSASITIGQAKTIRTTSLSGYTGNVSWSRSGSSAVILSSNNTNAVVEGRSNGTTNFIATVNNACGSRTASATINVTSGGGGDDCGVLPNPPCELFITVYPNPGASYLSINLDDTDIKSANNQGIIRILDKTGKSRVYLENYNLIEPVDITMLPNGYYHLFLESAGRSYHLQLKIEK